MYNQKIYQLCLLFVKNRQVGKPRPDIEQVIIEGNNLVRCLKYAGITSVQRTIIENKLNILLQGVIVQTEYVQDVFTGCYNNEVQIG